MKEVRQRRIVQLLDKHHQMTTDDLALALSVSRETLRRDLRALQQQGAILRTHGGACSTHDGAVHIPSFHQRVKSHHVRKAAAAGRALAWVDEEMTLALDASTTGWHLARQLPDIPLTVFTNSYRICCTLAKHRHVRVLHSGGWLDREQGSYDNPALLALLRHIDIDMFIFSCLGLAANGDIWEADVKDAHYKKLLLSRATQALLLVDKSKCGRTGDVCIGHVSQLAALIDEDESLMIENRE
ncbi:L-fucose operon activator [Erwinia sp. HR93]|uniref:L-fucose operon activator n=1 Tax=Erwinia sp. HR93 TaxID=3094840 RepID=UPI002ADEB0B6|nr:L-fucose operon activator [Erwinia sp. HR93]MEA1062365.1 L-fucose operon activator [Erwinia sp. HR93]